MEYSLPVSERVSFIFSRTKTTGISCHFGMEYSIRYYVGCMFFLPCKKDTISLKCPSHSAIYFRPQAAATRNVPGYA